MASHDSHGVHHYHSRKRLHKNLEKFPHPNKFKRIMDHFIYVVVIVGPILTIPQVTKIWIQQNASGVSLISWCTYLFTAIFWLLYAILHKERPLIISSAIWIILDISIVVGVILYA